jgi:crossover junction endodeoxyribonuclease RuvC
MARKKAAKEQDGIYLGLDLSMSSAGVAVVSVKGRTPELIQAFRIKTHPKERHGLRLFAIAKRLKETHELHGPFQTVVREKGFSRFAAATQAIFKVVGISDFIFRDYDIEEISPTTIKAKLAGNGKSSKEEVELAVRRHLNLPDEYKFESDDASDACGVILTYLFKEDIIDGRG